ncbi:MAG: hypothetical protein WBQ72_17335 [Terriglobales bacterium]
MKTRTMRFLALVVVSCLAALVAAQGAATLPSSGAVPNLINYSGVLKDGFGKPLNSVTGVTFMIYKDEQGGAPLWLETRNVTPDKAGRYSVQLGSMNSHGLPADLFQNGEARWLAVQIANEAEQPRTLLVAVPYALKAQDAETIGGLPPSAFVLAGSNSASGASSGVATTSAATNRGGQDHPLGTSNVTTAGGTAGKLPLFTSSTDIENSIVTQSGTSAISVAGNFSATGSVGAASFNLGSNLFAFGSYGNENAFLGFAGNTATTAVYNTATGYHALLDNTIGLANTAAGAQALLSNTGGSLNTASGFNSLSANTAGNYNTASGANSLYANTTGNGNIGMGYLAARTADNSNMTGSYNTFLGYEASASTGTLTNATAIGANAEVAESNALVLGSIKGVNGATATANVGIGIIVPDAQLHVVAQSNTRAIFAQGYNAPAGSGLSGATAIYSQGGNGDPNGGYTGGHGVVGIGGSSTSPDALPGYGIFGEGGINNSGPGGTGVSGFGGPGAPGNWDGAGGDFVGADQTTHGDGIDAQAGSGLAGNFIGNVSITGSISKGGGSFKIDHPLDPANKYLYHSFVESPDMMNIYNGNVALDANGEAIITMPEWFSVLNRDFRYQLTCIGGFAPLYIAEKLANNQFKIGGGKAGMEVSWQITGIRQDAWANAHRIPVEEEKDASERGFYLHPELYGAPAEKQIEWSRHPQMMKQIQVRRMQMKERQAQPAPSNKH